MGMNVCDEQHAVLRVLGDNPETAVRLGPSAWRVQLPEGLFVARLIRTENAEAHGAISTLLDQPRSSFRLLQRLQKCIPCDGGMIAVFDWVTGATLRDAAGHELPSFFSHLAKWHQGNAGLGPVHSRFTQCDYGTLVDFLTDELDYHLRHIKLNFRNEAIYSLIKPLSLGFPTYIHGDVHPGNIVQCENGHFVLLDPEYLHVGCNYLDLDYVDWYGVEVDPPPWWVIKEQAKESAASYFNALGVASELIPAIMKAVCLLTALRSHTNAIQFDTGDSAQELDKIKSVITGY
jgi:hypothetical protein